MARYDCQHKTTLASVVHQLCPETLHCYCAAAAVLTLLPLLMLLLLLSFANVTAISAAAAAAAAAATFAVRSSLLHRYELFLTPEGSDERIVWVTLDTATEFYEATGLRPYETYRVHLRAVSGGGYGPFANASETTLQYIPNGVVENLRVSASGYVYSRRGTADVCVRVGVGARQPCFGRKVA